MKGNSKISNNYNLDDRWIERELRHVNSGDKRLIKRLVHTSSLIERKASGSINQSCGTWKEAKGAYRLLSNKKVNAKEIYCSHYKETEKRIKGHKLVFSIQDTTYLDFDTHIKTQGLGSISKAYTKHKKGLILHSTLTVSMEGLPLGLTSQQCWARVVREETLKEKSRRRYIASSQDKEGYKWRTSLMRIPVNPVVHSGFKAANVSILIRSLIPEESGGVFRFNPAAGFSLQPIMDQDNKT